MFTALALIALSWQQGSIGSDPLVQSEILKNSGTIVAKLLTEAPSADNFVAVGQLFVDKSKPYEAQRFFQAALSIDPKHVKALEGAEASDKRIIYLNQRIKLFQDQIAGNATEKAYCSKAAIFFHLGKEQEAFEVLSEAQGKFGNKDDISQLSVTFQNGVDLSRRVLRYCEQKLDTGIREKNQAMALEALSEVLFLRFGHTDLSEILAKSKELLADKLNAESTAIMVKTGQN